MKKIRHLYMNTILLCMVGCCFVWLVGCQKYYWDYDCCWVSDEPKVELFQGCGSGRMTIDRVEYEFVTAQSNNATYITFYEKDPSFENDLGKLLWKADTELKNGKLYLTITIDNISNYRGQTIILSQRPVEVEDKEKPNFSTEEFIPYSEQIEKSL